MPAIFQSGRGHGPLLRIYLFMHSAPESALAFNPLSGGSDAFL